MVYGWGSQWFLIYWSSSGSRLYGHDLHTIWCSLTQGPRICMVLGVMMLLDTRTKNIYGLRERVWIVLEILGHFLFKGDGTTMYGQDLPTIRCYLTQKTRIYMV
jgi:hypothetical protein